MTNSCQHSEVANEFLLWTLPMRCCPITAIVSITRRQKVPMNPQIRLDVHVAVVGVGAVDSSLQEALLEVGKIPNE